MWPPLPAFLALGALAVVAAHAAPTSAIVGGLETSLLDGRRPTTARLERVYSGSASPKGPKGAKGGRPADESYARTGNRVHLSATPPAENPAPCAVAGRHFLHGQQVTRSDPCEFCVCLDGEVFCWWQDCPPSLAQGPCRGRPAFSSCQDESSGPAPSQPSEADEDAPLNVSSAAPTAPPPGPAGVDATATAQSASATTNSNVAPAGPAGGSASTETASPASVDDSSGGPDGSGSSALSSTTLGPASGASGASPASGASTASSAFNATTTSAPTTTELLCHVLGSTYRVGEVLPRDTGSCLQCECSPAGRVTCSPKDCLSVREEEDVYQPASSLDMFDVDSF